MYKVHKHFLSSFSKKEHVVIHFGHFKVELLSFSLLTSYILSESDSMSLYVVIF